jgi:hypothetical protein
MQETPAPGEDFVFASAGYLILHSRWKKSLLWPNQKQT